MNGDMRELEVCGPLVINGDGSCCVIQSAMGASNTAEGVAEDSGRDSILIEVSPIVSIPATSPNVPWWQVGSPPLSRSKHLGVSKSASSPIGC